MSLSSSTALVGGKDDDRNLESDQEKDCKMAADSDSPKGLEDGELEEGELDDDDDVGIPSDDKPEQMTESNIPDVNSGAINETPGKVQLTTDLQQTKRTKEIPSLFDLKTTKPKFLKNSAEEKGKKPFLKYIDHDRIDDEYYDDEDGMGGDVWPNYQMQGNDYRDNSDDQEQDDEFSKEIQQMLNRSANKSNYFHEESNRSPRGPYDSPSEDEENEGEDNDCPPTKLLRTDADDGSVSHGSITKGSKKASKRTPANGRMAVNDGDFAHKKSKSSTDKARKRAESGMPQNSIALMEAPTPEKRRLMDTPMDERPQCKFFLEGKCKKGSNCPFNHDFKRSNKQDICRYFLSGQCGKGNDCAFSHELKNTSNEDRDGKTENAMPKKKKALLGSPPPMQPRMMLPKDAKKIPSLFDIQIGADGPNAKEILQSAARRSVMMQSSNPKPGLLGVAPPMIAGMLGSMGSMRFPVNQGFFNNFGQLQNSQQRIEERGPEMLQQNPQTQMQEFMASGNEANKGSQQMNCTNMDNEMMSVRNEGHLSEDIAQNVSSITNSSSDLPCSGMGTNLQSQFSVLNNLPLQPPSAISAPVDQPMMPPQSSSLPAANPSFLSQLTSCDSFSSTTLLPSSAAEIPEMQMNVSPSASKVDESDKPQIVGGLDISHLPPIQRELYLRMFSQQNEANRSHGDPQPNDVKIEKRAEDEVEPRTNVNSNSSNDILKRLMPSQANSQSLVPDTVPLNQSSSSAASSFNINQMLSVICGSGGIQSTQQFPVPFGISGSAFPENQNSSQPVLEVSGSSLRGPYRLEQITLECNVIMLPSSIDPKDSKYSADPRVQRHKDDVIVRKDTDRPAASVTPSEPAVRVQTSSQRRDPRLARKETMAAKEDAQQPGQSLQQQQQHPSGGMSSSSDILQQCGSSPGRVATGGMPSLPGLPAGNMQGSGMVMGGVSMGNIQLGGMLRPGMPAGAGQQGGMPMGNLHQGGLNLNSIPMGGLPLGSMGGMSQGNMPQGSMGGMQQGNMPQGSMGGMQLGNMPQGNMGGMQQGNMGGMQQGNMGSMPQGSMGCMNQGNMGSMPQGSMGGMPQGNMGGMQQGNMGGMPQGNMGGMQQGNMGGMPQGNMGGMQQGNMGGMPQGSMGGMQPGNMGGMLMGGLQRGSRPSSGGLQQGSQINGMQHNGMPMSGMSMGGLLQGNLQMGGMQQGGPMMGSMQQGGLQGQQGGMSLGGMQHGGPQMGGMQVSMSVGGMQIGSGPQQRLNLPLLGNMPQGNGLLPAPTGGPLLQRGMVSPFVLQNQMSAMNSFQRPVSSQPNGTMLNGQMSTFGICRPLMLPNDMARPDSGGTGDGTGVGGLLQPRLSGPNSVSHVSPGNPAAPGSSGSFMQPNQPFPQPLLSLPLQSNMSTSTSFGQSIANLVQPSTQQPLLGNGPDVGDAVNRAAQPQLSSDVPRDSETMVDSERNADSPSGTTDATDNPVVNVDRTASYREDLRFKFKKMRTKDDTTENVVVEKVETESAAQAQMSESDGDTRKTLIRNKDKLEFRSPLADMGDAGSSSLSYGYNQPPNKKYQQMTEEESNQRRSVLSKTANRDGLKIKPRGNSAPRQTLATGTQGESAVPVFANLRQSQDDTIDLAPAPVQSIKDMFKSIDPTASPFC